jgi:hypothetical protein
MHGAVLLYAPTTSVAAREVHISSGCHVQSTPRVRKSYDISTSRISSNFSAFSPVHA